MWLLHGPYLDRTWAAPIPQLSPKSYAKLIICCTQAALNNTLKHTLHQPACNIFIVTLKYASKKQTWKKKNYRGAVGLPSLLSTECCLSYIVDVF